jgi:limonene-1,2-epoxide hydrolase
MKEKVVIERVDRPEHIDGDEVIKVKNCGNIIEAV